MFLVLMISMNMHPQSLTGLLLDTTMMTGMDKILEMNLRMPPHHGLVFVGHLALQAFPHSAGGVIK
jgi:hypothetical protein